MSNGTTAYYVLSGDSALEGIGTWHDVVHANLQFKVETTTATFAETGTFTHSSTLDLREHVVAHFAGLNTVLDFNVNNEMVLGSLLSAAADTTPYAWKLEDAGNGCYYIKLQDGLYLCANKDTAYYVGKDYKAESDSRYLWSLSSRGGNMFYLSNKYVNEDSTIVQYAVYDGGTGRIQFYLDLLTHGYQVLRFIA